MRALRTGLLAVAMLACAAGGAVAASCAQPHEEVALEIRLLQTELMVGALSCGQRADYNRFARAFGDPLGRHGRILTRYFSRSHGVRGEVRLNRYITRLANEASLRRGADGVGFCRRIAEQFGALRTLAAGDLPGFAASRQGAGAHGQAICAAVAARTASQ